MVLISEALAYNICSYKLVLKRQGIVAIIGLALVMIYYLTNIHEMVNFPIDNHLLMLGILVYILIYMQVLIYIYKYLSDFDEVMLMGYKLKEINRVTIVMPTLQSMLEYYNYYEVSLIRRFHTAVKLRFHIYCCQIKRPCILSIVLLFGLICWLFTATTVETEEFNFYSCFSLGFLVVNILSDIILILVGVLIELPRRLLQYIRLKRRRRDQLLDTIECSICLMDITAPSVTLPCHHTHQFHVECILRWKQQQNCCPKCRQVIAINIT